MGQRHEYLRESPLRLRRLPNSQFNERWSAQLPDRSFALAKAPKRPALGTNSDLTLAGHEEAASLIAESLGWHDLVPAAVCRYVRELGRTVSLADDIGVCRPATVADLNGDGALRLAVFDEIIGNSDRHLENILVDAQGQLHGIDHELSFARLDRMWARLFQSICCSHRAGCTIDQHMITSVAMFVENGVGTLQAVVGYGAARATVARAQRLLDEASIRSTVLPVTDLPWR